EFPERRARGVDCACFERETEQSVDQGAAENRVEDHLSGVLVKRGDDFKALWAMVNLVESLPEDLRLVTPAVPRVKDECRDEVDEHPTSDWWDVRGELEDRPRRQPSLPRDTCDQHNSKLEEVHEHYPQQPRLHRWKRPPRE